MEIGDFLSIISMVILALTVYLLWVQVRDLKKSVRGNIYAQLMMQVSRINEFWIEHPQCANLWGKVDYVVQSGTPDEIRKGWMMTIMMDFYQNIHYQFLEGNISEKVWEGWRKHIRNTFLKSDLKILWDKAKDVYSPEFRTMIEDALI